MFGNDGNMFGGMFDLNRDGKLDIGEFALMQHVVFGDLMGDDGGNIGEDRDDEISELKEAGLDIDELEMMDEEERAEALEEAGFDADDFDF